MNRELTKRIGYGSVTNLAKVPTLAKHMLTGCRLRNSIIDSDLDMLMLRR